MHFQFAVAVEFGNRISECRPGRTDTFRFVVYLKRSK